MKARKILEEILDDGGVVQAGVYLVTAEDLIAEQKTWDDADTAKNLDFTTADFWITTDDGHVQSIDDDGDLYDAYPDSKYFPHNTY